MVISDRFGTQKSLFLNPESLLLFRIEKSESEVVLKSSELVAKWGGHPVLDWYQKVRRHRGILPLRRRAYSSDRTHN